MRPYTKRALFSLFIVLLFVVFFPIRLTLYCISHGVRVPLEGVAFSVFLGIGGGLFFGVMYSLYLSLVLYCVRELKRRIKKVTDLMSVGWLSMFYLVNFVVLLFIVEFLIAPMTARHMSMFGWESALVIIPLSLFPYVVALSAVPHHNSEEALVTLGFLLIALGSFLRYFVVGYPLLLSHIGYGGGIPVELKIDGMEYQKHLLLRTEAVLIVYDCNGNRFEEIPGREVDMLTYAPLRTEARCRPPTNNITD